MAEHFDPYHKWLGIPLKDQPPNHYRLLSVDRFESDREVIDAAANRLMAYLHDLSTGEQSAAAQRLLNQIAAARLVLLTPAKKSAYDKQLRAESVPMAKPLAPQSPPVAKAVAPSSGPMAPASGVHGQTNAPPSPGPAGGGPIVVADEPRGRRHASSAGTRKSRKQPSLLPIVLLGVAALIIAGVATYIITLPDPEPPPRRNSNGAGNSQASSEPATRLRLLIEEKDRDGVLISIAGRQQVVPESGEISFPAKPGSSSLVIRRRGYQTINRDLDLTEGVTTVFQPNFKVDADAKARDEQFKTIPSDALDDLSKAKPGADKKDDKPLMKDGAGS